MKLSDLPNLQVVRDAEFEDLGLLPTSRSQLGYIKDQKYLWHAHGPVLSPFTFDDPLDHIPGYVLTPEPEDRFWDIHRWLIGQGFYPERTTEYGEGTQVHCSAAIGQDGFELHRKRRIPHAGWVKIGDRVTIGANSCVDRSLWKAPTEIGDDTHIDNLVHVAHNVRIGKCCMIVAGTVIGGSAVIGNDVFIGIGARIRPGVRIGDGAFIGMSVTVLKDVEAGERLTCR